MFSVVNTDGEIEESESVIINELLNIDDLSAIIHFFMNNNDFISKYGFDDYGVSFAFGNNIIPIHNTINFSKVVLRVDFGCIKDKQIIFDYLRAILISFKEELSETRYFAQKYKQYCEDLKDDYIASATGEEMADTISSLNTDEITSIIKMIPSERLIEVLNAKHSRQLKRKRVKEEE